MRDTLYIRLRDPAPDAPTAHVLLSADAAAPATARAFVRELPLDEVITLGAGRRIVVFVPGSDVRLSQVTVPARQPAKVLQAAPFVLEDQFAEDVETLHFALGSRLPGGAFPVAVVARSHMEEWLLPFRARGMRVDALVPETLALPWTENGPWSLLPEAAQVIVRNGAYAGFSCVPDDLDLFLQMAEAGTAASLRVLVSRSDGTDYTRLQRPMELLPGFDHPLEVFVRHWRPSLSIDLLQGAYSQREDLDRFWRPWRLAAQLVAAAFVLGVAVNGIESYRLKREVAALKTANEARFQQIFPRESRIVDLQAQLDQQLRALHSGGNGGGLFQLLQQAAQSLAETPGLTLKTAQFREGALFLDLSGTDVQVLEKLRVWFANHRAARLEVQTADAGEGGVQIRLKLTPGAA
ncbi:MAG: hypothetical protein NVS9B10_11270 [Nevskia sp.]